MAITSQPFQPKITQAGLAAAINASNNGVQLPITHIALGTGQKAPDGSETQLVAFKQASPIGGGGRVGPTQCRVHAAFQAGQNDDYLCKEVGFYSGNPATGGTLFAYYSTTDETKQPIVYVSDQFFVSVSYTLGLAALPADSVTVVVDQDASTALLLIGNHETAEDPHPQYLREVDIDVNGIILAAKKAVYPVGSLFHTKEDRNPADILGFGVWSRISGRFILGVQPSDPAIGTAGLEGGSRTGTVGLVIPRDGWGDEGGPPGTMPRGRLMVGSGQHENKEVLESLRQAGNGNQVSATVDKMPPYLTYHIWERQPDPTPAGSGQGFDPNTSSGGVISG